MLQAENFLNPKKFPRPVATRPHGHRFSLVGGMVVLQTLELKISDHVDGGICDRVKLKLTEEVSTPISVTNTMQYMNFYVRLSKWLDF